jgi:hypothetical protein
VKFCPQCDQLTATLVRENSSGRYFCWRCFSAETFVPNECEPPPAVMDGVMCLRRVENLDDFALLFVTAESNQAAMILGFVTWGVCNMEARPIWEL